MSGKIENKSNFAGMSKESAVKKILKSDSSLVFTIKDGVPSCFINGEEEDIVSAIFNYITIDPRVEDLLEKGKTHANIYREKACKEN